MEVEFTSMEVKYIPEEEEHMLLMKVFEVSVVDSMENDPRVTYLERFKSARMLSRELMKEVIQDRLSLFLLNDEAPLDYLFYSYYRAHEAARSVAYIKDLNVKTVMTSLVSLAKKLAVDFFRIEILKFRITKSSAWLLRLLMSELACEEFLLLGFLDQLFESDYDSIQYILKEVYDDLRVRVLKGDSTMSLSALELLVKCPVAAKALVSHPCWIPRNGTGRDLELYSVLGCFFRVSALPDDPLFQAEHNIRIYEHTRRDLNHWYEGLAKVVSCLLENPITRENTLDFLAEVINKNSVMEFRASSGMLVNLIAVMLRLCQPLIDDVLSAQTIIDPKYVLYENRLRLRVEFVLWRR